MNRIIIFLFCFCYSITGQSQKIFIDGTEGNRPLVWAHFKGTPDEQSEFFANTFWHMGFAMSDIRFHNDTAILKGYEVNLEFEPSKSWVKKGKETADLLKHEQGHFDIAIICQREIIHAINQSVFVKATLQAKLGEVFNGILEKYKKMENQYDEETNHSIDTAQQEKWDLFIKNELERTAKL